MWALGDLSMKVLSLILMLLFLAACTSTMTMDEEVEQNRKQALSKIDILAVLWKEKL
jgi:cytochrome c556